MGWSSLLRGDASVPGKCVLASRIETIDEEDAGACNQRYSENDTADDNGDFQVALQLKELQ